MDNIVIRIYSLLNANIFLLFTIILLIFFEIENIHTCIIFIAKMIDIVYTPSFIKIKNIPYIMIAIQNGSIRQKRTI